jgi:hypothetical protein
MRRDQGMKVKTTIEVSRERIADLLCCGMEGGIGYWGRITKYVPPPKDSSLDIGGSWDRVDVGEDKRTIYKHIHWPMCEAGGGIVIADTEWEYLLDDSPDEYKKNAAFQPTLLNWERLQEGLQVMAEKYPRAFADFMSEDDDAETGDVFVQCAVLGEIIFG